MLVVGGLGTRQAAGDEAFVGRRRPRWPPEPERITSVCTGAFVLAAAGLLDGHRATTHWASCDDLAPAAPGVDVEPDRIYVRDGNRWTSAGVTAGIDLALALVEDDHGPELAHQVAGWLVVFVRRPGGQAQFSAQLQAQPARTPAIAEVQRWLPDHLDEDLDGRRPRPPRRHEPAHLRPGLPAETGTTPAAYVEALRVEAARRLLETTDLTVRGRGPSRRAPARRDAPPGLPPPGRHHARPQYRQHFAPPA